VVAAFAAVVAVSAVGFAAAFAAALPLAAFAARMAVTATKDMNTEDIRTTDTDMGMRAGSQGHTGVSFTHAIEATGLTGPGPSTVNLTGISDSILFEGKDPPFGRSCALFAVDPIQANNGDAGHQLAAERARHRRRGD